MSRLAGKSPHGASGTLVLVVLVCVSIVTVTLYSREGATGPVHTLRSAVQVAAWPFTWLGSHLTAPLDALSGAVEDASADGETLSELREENTKLTAELAELGEYKLENERLRGMLDLASAYGTEGVGARVVGVSSDEWSRTVTIDKGSSSGIAADMPVTDGNGVVGQVTSVSAYTSTVTLLSDPTCSVSALLQGSRATGVLSGSVDGSLHLEYVSADVDVSIGELVVTSGLGGVYPKGLVLGTVASVTGSASGVFHDIVVEPLADSSNHEEVYIITSYDAAVADATADDLLEGGSSDGSQGQADGQDDGAAAEGAASGEGA